MKTNFKEIITIPTPKHIYNEAYYHELISKSNVLPSLPSKEELGELLKFDGDFGYNLIIKLKNGKYAVYAGRTGCATCGDGEHIKHVRVFNSLDDFFDFANIDTKDYSSLEDLFRENYIVYSESFMSGFKNANDIIVATGVLIFKYNLEKYVLDENDNLCIFKDNIAIIDSKTYILEGDYISIFDSNSIRPFIENIRSGNLIVDTWKFKNVTDADEKSHIINYYINKFERSLNVEGKHLKSLEYSYEKISSMADHDILASSSNSMKIKIETNKRTIDDERKRRINDVEKSIKFSNERKESITIKIELLNNLK